MSIYSESGNSARLFAVGLIIAAFLIFASISPAFGQERSTDRDNPTPLTAKVITDELDGTDTAYFYKFTAGPGKLTVTIEVKASGTNAGAMLDLFDGNSRPILSDVLAQGVDGGTERIVNNVQLSGKREIVIKIKGLKYGDTGGTGTYKITLDGPVIVAQAAAPAPAPAAAPAPVPAPAPAGGNAPAAGNGGAAAPAGSNLLSGQLDPADERMLFHRVNVSGPGQVTFGFSVKATDAKAGAKFAVLTEKNSVALPPLELQGGESISKVVTFDKAQTLTIMVQVTKFPGNDGHGSYSIQLSGPAGAGAEAPAGSNSVSGQLDPDGPRGFVHFVNVNAPGQVTISLSLKATDPKAGVAVGVTTGTSRILFPAVELKAGESISKPVTIDKVQTLNIIVEVLQPPDKGGNGTYSIQVNGPVTLIK